MRHHHIIRIYIYIYKRVSDIEVCWQHRSDYKTNRPRSVVNLCYTPLFPQSSCECTQWRDNAEKERERSLSTYTAFNCCDFVCQRRNKRVGFGWGPVFLIFFYHVHINLKIHTDHNYRFKMCQTNTVSSDDEAKRTWPLLYWPVD